MGKKFNLYFIASILFPSFKMVPKLYHWEDLYTGVFKTKFLISHMSYWAIRREWLKYFLIESHDFVSNIFHSSLSSITNPKAFFFFSGPAESLYFGFSWAFFEGEDWGLFVWVFCVFSPGNFMSWLYLLVLKYLRLCHQFHYNPLIFITLWFSCKILVCV